MKTIAKLMALCMLFGTLAIAQDKPADTTKAPAAASDKDTKDKDKKAKKEKKSKKEKKGDAAKDAEKAGDKK
jgi:ABC-type transporter MlaC component